MHPSHLRAPAAQLAALDVIPDEDPTAACNAARELMARINDGSGILVLTDVFGATPSRIASTLAEPYRVDVVTGVNLPLLVKALYLRRAPLEEVTSQLIESARNAIFAVGPPDAAASRAESDRPAGAAAGSAPAP
jgi:PTS system ascorbate-specific IIA component